MIDLAGRQAAADLAEALLATRPLIELLDPPVRIETGNAAAALPAANRVSAAIGLPALTTANGNGGEEAQFHRIVSDRLAVAELADALSRIPEDAYGDVEAQALQVAADDFGEFCGTVEVATDAGIAVRAYTAGPPDAPTVVLSSACGMPVRLVERWVRHLAGQRRVVSWESRGLFEGVAGFDDFDGATGVDAQAADCRAVLDELDVREAHVVGLCGGAVVAARVAATAPDRVQSVSLWHGDFDLGDAAPKTDHQRNLLGLMDLAAATPQDAAGIHRVMCQSMLGTVPADLAAQALYPYVTPELFLRYCRLNGAIMHEDIRPTLEKVHQTVLVVTSRTDSTAHPEGSIEVARRLKDATLLVNDTGDHISLFRGDAGLMAVLDEFLDDDARTARV